jgi:hypothetical protein
VTRRVAVGLCLLVTVLGAVGVAAPPAAAQEDEQQVSRLLVLSMPGVSYRDLDLETLPNLRALLERSALADLSVRGVRRRPNLGDGYVTIGAGARAVGRTLDEGQCFDAPEPFEEGSAREAMARRAGIPVADIPESSVVCLAQPAIVARNEGLLFDAEPGALAEALGAANVHAAVVGNADQAEPTGTAGYARTVGLALAEPTGVVAGGRVSQQLLERDPAAPFGVRAASAAYADAFREQWRDDSVVVVEASDLVRFDAYRQFVAADERAALRNELLQWFDALVGEMLAEVDPQRDGVMIVGPAHMGGTARLTMATLQAPGVEPGLMRSAYTRHTGIVSIVDVAPTILDLFGIERPDAMEGRPFEVGGSGGDFEDRIDWLIETDEAARFRDRMITGVTTFYVTTTILLALFALVAFVRYRRALTTVQIVALSLLGFLPATYLAGLFPFHDWGAIAYWAFILVVGVALGLVAWFTTNRMGITTLIVALGIVVGVLVIDVVLGARLQFNTSLGYSPTVAGRFAGIGNLAYAQLAAGTLLLAGLVAARVGGRRGAWIAVALLGTAVVVDGAPFFGSDVGGVLSMVPAYAYTATVLLGWKVRRRAVTLYGLAALVLIGLFAAYDASRPEDDQTHLGRLVHTTTDGGWDAFATVVERKLAANFDVLFSSVWTVMLPVVLGLVAYLVYRSPGRLRGIVERIPPLRAALQGLVVLAVLGFALNDSGIAIPGVMLGVVTPVLVVLTVRGEHIVVGRDIDEERELRELVRT